MYRETNILENLSSFAESMPTMSAIDALSVKLRPVAEREGHTDRYVYPDEYKELETRFSRLKRAPTHSYRANPVYEVDEDSVLLGHETGPEFLLLADAFLSQYSNIIPAMALLLALTESLRRLIRRNCERNDPSRHYHDVEFLRVEMRTTSPSGELKEAVVETLRIGDAIDKDDLQEKLNLAARSLRGL